MGKLESMGILSAPMQAKTPVNYRIDPGENIFNMGDADKNSSSTSGR